MATLVRSGATGVTVPQFASVIYPDRPNLTTQTPDAGFQITGLIPGVDIKAGDACRLDAAGLVQLSDGTADNASAKVLGFAAADAIAASEGNVTLYYGVNIFYSDTVVPGKSYYASATPGALDDAPVWVGQKACAYGLPNGRLALARVL